jgi:myo-inositol-1(or 4)-monophosphatase
MNAVVKHETLDFVSYRSGEELRAVAAAAARAAGVVLLEQLGRASELVHKNERTSVVTAADLAAQAEIERVITGHFPTHAIVGEEGNGGAEHAELTWLVDPLDGTSNFAHGVPLACTSIAVTDAAGVVAGAIFDPFREELFTAVRGGGAWLESTPLRVSDTARLSAAVVCTGVQSDDPAAIAAFGERIVGLAGHCRAVRCLGSPAVCLAYVAAGRIDAFVEADSTYAWDVGAGSLLITEAGGRIEDLDGGPLNLGPGLANVLASNGRIHDDVAAIVRSVGARADDCERTSASERASTNGPRGRGTR